MKLISLIPAVSLLGALLAGCNVAPTATNARVVSGTVMALSLDRSSVTVQGQNLSLSGASVTVNGRSVTAKALSVGQRVRLSADGNKVTEVDVSLELKGVVGAVDTTAMTITVAGITVKYSATTRFDVGGENDDSAATSSATIDSVKPGMFVEVTGTTDTATGSIVATKIEVKTPGELGEDGQDNEHELKGTVKNLSGTSFQLGEATVKCDAPCTLPMGLKNGDLVEAEGVFDAATKTLTAKKVKLEDGEHGGENENEHPVTPGSSVILQDDLHMLDAGAKTFKLEGFVVDYSAATVTGTLKERADVKVEGVVDMTNTKLVKASAVTVIANREGEGNGGGGHGGSGEGGSGSGGNGSGDDRGGIVPGGH
jgi:Domain of unknown function (DUF5666)